MRKEVTTMSTVKNLIVSLLTTLMVGVASVFGMLAGFAIWNNGLGERVEEKTRKLFNRKK